jgi:DNA polymerase-3 subunit alpha
MDDRKACTLLRSGKTAGVFQYEGGSTARGARQMKVRTTYDACICLALFRPAMMNSGMTERYLEQRALGEAQEVPTLIAPLLEDTFGVPVFQEQVIDIMRRVNLPYDLLNKVLKAVKASNGKIGEYALDTFNEVGPKFFKLAIAAGMTKDEARFSWQMVKEFSDYGFNKAHAVSYGLMSYVSGYLKAHHPLEFMCAVLDTWAGSPKERMYIAEARRLKIPIVKSDVNHSLTGWAIDPTRRTPSLRRGLITIKGIGQAASNAIVGERLANGPYESIEDMIQRLPARPVSGGKDYVATGTLSGVFSTLAEAGALRSIGYDQ